MFLTAVHASSTEQRFVFSRDCVRRVHPCIVDRVPTIWMRPPRGSCWGSNLLLMLIAPFMCCLCLPVSVSICLCHMPIAWLPSAFSLCSVCTFFLVASAQDSLFVKISISNNTHSRPVRARGNHPTRLPYVHGSGAIGLKTVQSKTNGYFGSPSSTQVKQ